MRAIDILGALHRRGAINGEMHQAGEQFRNSFRRAQLDPLRAGNLLRMASGRSEGVPFVVLAAREYIWRALNAVGRIHSAGGACLWYVIGGEQSLKQWALSEGWSGRHVSEETATGILIGSLGTLAQHYPARHCNSGTGLWQRRATLWQFAQLASRPFGLADRPPLFHLSKYSYQSGTGEIGLAGASGAP